MRAAEEYKRALRYLGGRAGYAPVLGVEWLTKAARKGHGPAQQALSLLYLNGARCHGAAGRWFAEASASERARENAALFFPQGVDIECDPDQAFTWARAAAQTGLPSAQANLGMFYARGMGCRQDFAEAALWYRRAADKGDAAAALGLGVIHERGLAGTADLSAAISWYRKSAASGNQLAQEALHRLTSIKADL